MSVAERFGEPGAQGSRVGDLRAVRFDDRLFARLERTVEIGRHHDIGGNEPRAAKRPLQFRRKLDQNDARAGFGRRLFDLRKTLGRRRIDAGDVLEVEDQEAAFHCITNNALTC